MAVYGGGASRRRQWVSVLVAFFSGGLLVHLAERPHVVTELVASAPCVAPSSANVIAGNAVLDGGQNAPAHRDHARQVWPCRPQLAWLKQRFHTAWICHPDTLRGDGIRQCYFKAPGGRWLQNGWLEVKELLPLMAPALRGSVSASSPFVYVDVGCKDAAEGVFVLETFPEGAQVVALEMRPEWAEVCEANSKRAASNVSTVTVLNAAAAVEQGSGSFTTMGDRSSMAPAGAEVKPGEERVEIPFVTLQSVWEKHIAPRKIHLLKTDAEGWDGLILNASRALLESHTVQTFIFEYHGRPATVYWHGELREFATEFWRLGYQCFHITATFLFPLTPPELWSPSYEFHAQGNVVCSLPGPVLTSLYENYYGDPGLLNTFEARKTEPHMSKPGQPMVPHVATNYTGFAADYGKMLRDDLGCLTYD